LIRRFDDCRALPEVKEQPFERQQGNRAAQFVSRGGSPPISS
jgi:hypothetical protein